MTSDININVERIDEAFMIGLFDLGGWESDRMRMSKKDLKDLRSQFHHPIKMSVSKLDFWLNHLFANFYPMLKFIRKNQIAARNIAPMSIGIVWPRSAQQYRCPAKGIVMIMPSLRPFSRL